MIWRLRAPGVTARTADYFIPSPPRACGEREMSVTVLHNGPSRFPLPVGEGQGEGTADHPLTRCHPEPAAGGRRIPPHLECFDLGPST
jgi:hypothetical protein